MPLTVPNPIIRVSAVNQVLTIRLFESALLLSSAAVGF